MSKKIVGDDGKTYVQKKPFYKRVWFWLLVVIVVIVLGGGQGGGSDKKDTSVTSSTKATSESASSTSSTKNYRKKTKINKYLLITPRKYRLKRRNRLLHTMKKLSRIKMACRVWPN